MTTEQSQSNETGKNQTYSNERESDEKESILQRLHSRFGEQVRASGSGDKQRRRTATQVQVLAQEIGQVGPFHGVGEYEERFLSFLQLGILAAIAAMVVVVVVMILIMMIVIVIFVVVMVVALIGGGATEIGEIERLGREGPEAEGGKSRVRVEEKRSGRVDSDMAPFGGEQERVVVLADADRIRKGFHLS